MKISFFIANNNQLSEPYKDFKEDHRFIFTNQGFIYPEGESKHIECYDARMFNHFAKSWEREVTTIDTEASYEEPSEDLSDESFKQAILDNKEMLKYIMETKYASIKPMSSKLSLDEDYVKAVLESLADLNIVNKYASYWRITKEVKPLLEMILKSGGF